MDDKLNSVLGNPQLMAQIAAAVRGAAEPTQPAPPAAPAVQQQPLYGGEGGTDRALNLLGALAPFLKTQRRDKLDAITRALTVASIYKNTKNI